MCGIATIYSYRGGAPPVETRELDLIRDRMRERGPDSAGSWISPDGNIGLAHRRLAILDLSAAGHQPMFSADKSLAIVFNGEIYNYPQLRKELEKSGTHFQSDSDTEVLLHLYRRQGISMLGKIRGMYAFALWDDNQKQLLAARDPLGIKPLYYSDSGKTLRLASQVKALLAGGGIDSRPDPAGHAGFFLWGHVPEPHTLFASIKPLAAGCCLLARKDQSPRIMPFCDLVEILGRPANPSDAPETGSAADMLRDSVRHHLLSDVPVGLFLSSGIDSSALAALAVENSQAPVFSVTLGMDEYRGKPQDETVLAEEVSRYYGTRHSTVWLSSRDFEDHIDRLLQSMDQPSIDGVNTYFVSLAAVRSGLKVALSGLGGDEIFGGYSDFRRIPSMVSTFAPFANLGPLTRALRAAIAGPLAKYNSAKYASLLEYGGTYGGAYLLTRSLFLPWELPELIDPEMAAEGFEQLRVLEELNWAAKQLHSPRLKVSALQMKWYMRNQLLRDADWAGMAHGMEIRVPLVDFSLIRNLQPLLASTDPPKKETIASAPLRPLPPKIVNRPKTGFSIPVDRWLPAIRGKKSAKPGLKDWAKHVYQSQTGRLAA